jgi:hypothetical protein
MRGWKEGREQREEERRGGVRKEPKERVCVYRFECKLKG